MTTFFSKPIVLLFFLILTGCSSIKTKTSKNQEMVKSFIKARNNYNIEKVGALIEENYSEIFIDGSKEIEGKNQLMDRILWGKELDSKIKLLDIETDGNTIVTIEENTNFLDVAMKRKPRKFKIVYSFINGKIQHQKIDTLPGYHAIMRFNSGKYKKFAEYCEQHNLIYNGDSLNQEFGIHLRKVLEQYKAEN
nr:nuclear transport factor 2 family protein [uncultured Allomuricauda sp.]